MKENEWKENFRMNWDVFMILANEVRPFLLYKAARVTLALG